jgi:hypothetical protein
MGAHRCAYASAYDERMDEWWIRQIEDFRQRSKMTDVALAKRLDISASMLAHVRLGRRALPLHGRLRLLDALGYVLTRDLLLRVLPEEARSAIIDANAVWTEASYSGEADPNAGRDLPPVWR